MPKDTFLRTYQPLRTKQSMTVLTLEMFPKHLWAKLRGRAYPVQVNKQPQYISQRASEEKRPRELSSGKEANIHTGDTFPKKCPFLSPLELPGSSLKLKNLLSLPSHSNFYQPHQFLREMLPASPKALKIGVDFPGRAEKP